MVARGLPNLRNSKLTLEEAREIAALDLVSARDVKSESGHTYFEMEEATESPSHRSATEHGIQYFSSIGYRVFGEGVGVKGTNTLADFLAVRDARIVFVETLSDSNINEVTLARKARLRLQGELCFILFTGTKRSSYDALRLVKRSIEEWADVLYFRLDGYGGNFIDAVYSATIAYDTTRSRGIRVALSFEQTGRHKVSVAVRFITHFYRSVPNTVLYNPVPIRKHYEEIFLRVFRRLAYETGRHVKLSSARPDLTAFRAMRRNAGVRMLDSTGRVGAWLTSQYRGAPVVAEVWDDLFAEEIALDEIYGVFAFEQPTERDLGGLISAFHGIGIVCEFDQEELVKVISVERNEG
jgi:hypothetical protein